MTRKPETPDERVIYKNAYYVNRGDGLTHDHSRAIAYAAVDTYRIETAKAQRELKRVVTAQTEPDGRPAGMSDEDWNYGCTPGRFADRRNPRV